MNIKNFTWIIIVVDIVVGVFLGVFLAIRKNKKSKTGTPLSTVLEHDKYSWETLMKSQILLDEMRVDNILKWVNGVKDSLQEGDNLFLFKATKTNIEKIGYQYTELIDSNTNIVACSINTESGNIAHIQLFTFGTLSANVEELFSGCDYAVITV